MEKESEGAEGSDDLESAESGDNKQEDFESKDEERSSEKGEIVETEGSGSGEAADKVKGNVKTVPADKEETHIIAGANKDSNQASGKEKDEEELCLIPDTVMQVDGKDSDKQDDKNARENTRSKSEKPAITEVVEKPKPTIKTSSAGKKAEASYTRIAAVEPIVEYRYS
jgi:hypothetical protein